MLTISVIIIPKISFLPFILTLLLFSFNYPNCCNDNDLICFASGTSSNYTEQTTYGWPFVSMQVVINKTEKSINNVWVPTIDRNINFFWSKILGNFSIFFLIGLLIITPNIIFTKLKRIKANKSNLTSAKSNVAE